MKNWKATARLASHLAGNAPYLDAILAWEITKRQGVKAARKLTRTTRLDDMERVNLPLARRTIGGIDVYCCSDPILPVPYAPEYVERITKRLDGALVASLLAPKERKSISTSSGAYKQRYAQIRIRPIDRVVWFFRGDRYDVQRLLRSVYALGTHHSIGYGIIARWEFEEMNDDYSIFAQSKDGTILMKTIPAIKDDIEDNTLLGYKRSYGSVTPPYWHPENYREVLQPC
jgi:CRISPR type IV-associated protein Csf3